MNFKWNTEAMSPSQRKIADYIQKHTNQVLLLTEQEIADAVKVSIASVSRFWRSVGYKNLKDFKSKIGLQFEVSPAAKMNNVMRKLEGQELQYHTLKNSVDHLYKTMEQFSSDSFHKAVDLLLSADKIYLHGPGPSNGLADLFSYRMARFGMNMHLIKKGGSELFEELTHVKEEDTVVLFGFIRLLPEANVILKHAKLIGYKTIILTDQLVFESSSDADVVLFASRGETREFHSMIGPTFMIENLIISLGMRNKEANLVKLEQLSHLRKRYASDLPR